MGEQKGGEQIGCPDSAMWLDIAAAKADAKLTSDMSEHAATCVTCGPQLHEAVRLFADSTDSGEDRFLETLNSSSAEWQEQMAQRLALSTPQQAQSARPRWFSFGLLAAAAAFVVAVLVIGISWLRTSRRPASLSVQSVVTVPSPTPTTPSPQTLPVLVEAITLEPGLTRGVEHLAELRLHHESKSVLVTLLFLDEPPQRLQFEMLDSARKMVWNKNVSLTGRNIKDRRIAFTIPAMKAGNYEILASQPGENIADRIADYHLKITYQ